MRNALGEDLITQTSQGFWFVKGDTHFGPWIEQAGRLDHDQWALKIILPHIKCGSIVIDVGANIGTHTIAYLRAVEPSGGVCAYEPNPVAFECLERNCPNAYTVQMAVSDALGWESMNQVEGNPGANSLNRQDDPLSFKVTTLDYEFQANDETDTALSVSFIKIDVEGCEPEVLRGGRSLIARERPVMWIEINPGALEKRRNHASEIEEFLKDNNYSWKFYPENCTWTSPQSDILCLPNKIAK
jgi:FkbM family methyltransferase